MAGLLLSLAIVAAAALLVVRGPSHRVDPRVDDAPRASPAAATEVLQQLTTALEAYDQDALSDLAPDGDGAAAALLRDLGRNAGALDLDEVTARLVEQVGTVNGDGAWTAMVELGWRFSGYDREPARAQVAVSFAPRGDGLGIAGFAAPASAADAREPLWLQARLSVASAPGTLVMVDGPRREAEQVSLRVVRGVEVVRRVLPDWDPHVVVEVPSTSTGLDRALGAEAGTFRVIAAVTAPVGEATGRDAPVHVFVNPEVTAGLRRAGAQVVMSHELAHVATAAASTGVEPWLSEGFADYVALRDTRLPDSTTLGRALAAVRRDGVPDELPGPEAFGRRGSDLQAAYELAWLACRVVADRIGERGLLSVHRAASRGTPTGTALRRAGLGPDDLVTTWRSWLAAMAGAGRGDDGAPEMR